MTRTTPQSKLDKAYQALERHAPGRFSRVLRWIRKTRGKKVRVAAGVALVGLGLLGPVLPVAGVWMVPIGLLLIAEEVPNLQEPVAELSLWLERQWLKLRSRWQGRWQPA